MFIRYFVWTCNAAIVLRDTAIKSRFGIKVLYSRESFDGNFYVVPETGEKKGYNRHDSWNVIIQKVIDGGMRSRARFE